MERKVVIVRLVVHSLGLLCAITGFAAEFTRTENVQPSGTTCSYPGSPAYGLGITALVSLLVAQIIVTVATKCRGFKGSAPTSFPRWNCCLSWFFQLFFVLVSWALIGYASLGLLVGAYFNHRFVYTLDGTGLNRCPVATQYYFAEATVVGLLGLVMHLSYYTDVSSESENLLPTRQGDVPVGQPQFPPREGAQDPVTVHEDTHAKGQDLQV